ncbi:hypothetical protein HDE_08609 [Halotydeus destructor]|nr:hypothetical protein HDE_08609 [Halotydeus destructor]
MEGLLLVGRKSPYVGTNISMSNADLQEYFMTRARRMSVKPFPKTRYKLSLRDLESRYRLQSQDGARKTAKKSTSVFRITFTIICTLVAIFQCWRLLLDYLSYPTGVNVLVDEPTSMREALPGVTVCDNNRFQMKHLEQGMAEKNVHLNGSRLDKQKAIDQFLLDSNLTTSLHNMSQLFEMGSDADDLIKYLKCDQTWLSDADVYKECENIPIMESLQFSGKCFTLFHNLSTEPIGKELGTVRRNNIVKSPKTSLDTFQVRQISDSDRTESYNFAPNEVVQIMVDFQPDQVTNLYQTVGGKLYIHDTRDIPALEDPYFDLEPGHYYEFYIRRVTTVQLPKPYDTNCADYVKLNFPVIRDTKMLWAPLTRQQCVKRCLVEKGVVGCAGLWAPEIPFLARNPFLNWTHNETGQHIYWGGWHGEVGLKAAKKQFVACIAPEKPACQRACGIECVRSNYEVIATRSEWPFKEIIESATEKEMEEIEARKKCCAFVSIRYSTFVQTVRDFEPRFKSMTAFVNGMGGLVSMWIGISVISLFDIVHYIISYLHRFCTSQ